MKKAIFIMCVLISSSFACVCSSQIQQGFLDTKTPIIEKLQIHQDELKKLQTNLKNNIKTIENHILERKISNELQKEQLIKKSEIIFLFKQKLELER